MELVLVGKMYELYKPMKPPVQKNRMQKIKNPSLEKLVTDINQRMASANQAKGTQNLEAVKSGLEQMEKEKSLEESFREMMKSAGASGAGNGSGGDFAQQLKDTYTMLTDMTDTVKIIEKYEKLYADTSKPLEEREFYREATERLKKGFEDRFSMACALIQMKNLSWHSSVDVRKNLGLASFEGMNSEQITEKLQKAQELLKSAGFEQGETENSGKYNIFFEGNYTWGIKNFDKYGMEPPSNLSDLMEQADSPFLKGTLYVSNLNEYHRLDTQA